jgi:hypothetical protein
VLGWYDPADVAHAPAAHAPAAQVLIDRAYAMLREEAHRADLQACNALFVHVYARVNRLNASALTEKVARFARMLVERHGGELKDAHEAVIWALERINLTDVRLREAAWREEVRRLRDSMFAKRNDT